MDAVRDIAGEMPEAKGKPLVCRVCADVHDWLPFEIPGMPTRWIEPGRGWRNGVCPACQKERAKVRERERREKVARQRIDEFRARFPERFRDVGTSDFRPEILAQIKTWLADPWCWSLLVHGAIGAGKTHLAYYVVARWMYCASRDAEWQDPGQPVIATAPEMVSELQYAVGEHSERAAVKKYSEAPMLFVDELGKEKLTDYANTAVYRVLDARYADNRPTVVTSNLAPQEIAERMPRVMDRFTDGMILKLSERESRRGKCV